MRTTAKPTSSTGLVFGAMLTYAREVGGPPLRKMTYLRRSADRMCLIPRQRG